MPLSSKGQSIMRDMQREYGSKKGKQVFYAMENSKPKFRRVVKARLGKGHGIRRSDG